MKKILQKELREQLPLAVLGLLILGTCLFALTAKAAQQARAGALSAGYPDLDAIQPLVSTTTYFTVGLVAGLFGAILGVRQILAERHQDLRAFLFHRPIRPTDILIAKAGAGLLLYTLAIAVPLALFLWNASRPGQIAAPFRAPMILPFVALWLNGLIAYGAGLITGLRQARWYASRTVCLGLPIVTGTIAVVLPEFWLSLIFIGLAGVAMTLAVQGSFLTNGTFRGQSRAAKAGLALVATAGATLAVAAVVTLIISLAPGDFEYHYSQYQITTNGQVIRVTSQGAEPEIDNLDGTPFRDPATGAPLSPMDRRTMGRYVALSGYLRLEFPGARPDQRFAPHSYATARRHFFPLQIVDQTLWFVAANGQIEGYNGLNRQRVPNLAPPARTAQAAQSAPVGPDRILTGSFDSTSFHLQLNSRVLVATRKAILELDLSQRTQTILWSSPPDEPIVALRDGRHFLGEAGSNRLVVATSKEIRGMTRDGRTLFAYRPSFVLAAYDHVIVHILTGPESNSSVLRFEPPWTYPAKDLTRTASKLVTVGPDGPLDEPITLPPLPDAVRIGHREDLVQAILPPILGFSVNRFPPDGGTGVRLAIAVTFGIVGFLFARRARCNALETIGCTLFHVTFGLPGLLTALALQETPAAESCPACGQRRAVTGESCPHCAAPNTPPARNGTEIFEPIPPSPSLTPSSSTT